MVRLDAYSFALNYPQRFYATVAEKIAIEEHVGLRTIIPGLLKNDESRRQLVAFAASSSSGDLGFALQILCEAARHGPDAVADEHYAWTVLLGLDINWSQYPYKRKAALRRLGELALMFGAVGLGGVVILFDEAETIDQLWNIRSRMTAYTTIGAACQNAGLWTVFGITERFNLTVDADLARIGDLYFTPDENAVWFLSKWKKQFFQIIHPPTIDRRIAPIIAERVAALYRDAHDIEVDKSVMERALSEWSRNPTRNPRRLIRGVVECIDQARQESLATSL
jgi:hypothetical protein